MKACYCTLSSQIQIDEKSGFCEICEGGDNILTFYTNFVRHSARYPNSNIKSLDGLNYCTQKLTSEAGEVSGKIGKFLNKYSVSGSTFSSIRFHKNENENLDNLRKDLILELGDLLWYISESAYQLDTTIEDILIKNINKISDRISRGTVIGDGDDR